MACMLTGRLAGNVIYPCRGGVVMKHKQLADDKADANELACRSKNENSEIKQRAEAKVAVDLLKYK